MKMPPLDERGSVSVLIAIAVAAIGALIALQMSMAYRSNQIRQSVQRTQMSATYSIQRLAQLFKRAYDLHEMHPDCNIGGSTGRLQRVQFGNGRDQVGFCFERRNEICITENVGGQNSRFCASPNVNVLNWRNGPSHDPVEFTQFPNPASSQQRYENRIRVPPPTDPIWRSCLSPATGPRVACVQIALCPEGDNRCTEREAVARQVIHLGFFN